MSLAPSYPYSPVAFAFRARRVSASALGNARGTTPMTKRPPSDPVPRFANGFYFSAPHTAHPAPGAPSLQPATVRTHFSHPATRIPVAFSTTRPRDRPVMPCVPCTPDASMHRIGGYHASPSKVSPNSSPCLIHYSQGARLLPATPACSTPCIMMLRKLRRSQSRNSGVCNLRSSPDCAERATRPSTMQARQELN